MKKYISFTILVVIILVPYSISAKKRRTQIEANAKQTEKKITKTNKKKSSSKPPVNKSKKAAKFSKKKK